MTDLFTKIDERLKKHPEITALSFDIFDTILFRMTAVPKDVFEIVGRKAVEKKLLPQHIHPSIYRMLRTEAERDARKRMKEEKSTDEILLSDIMEALPPVCAHAKELMELEIETEKEVCFLNPDFYGFREFLEKHADYRVMLVSDMYLTTDIVCQLLRSVDFPVEKTAGLFISGEAGVNKKTGALFRHVLAETALKPENLLHIGDSYISDVVNASAEGIHTIYYDTIHSGGDTLLFEKLKYGDVLPAVSSLRKYAYCSVNDFSEEQKEWFRLGAFVFGPVMSGFAEWILDEADRERITEIYPLMREGWMISRLLENAVKYRKTGYHIKPMYISRRSVLLPGFIRWDERAYERLLAIPKATVGTVLDIFQVTDPALEEYREIQLIQLDSFSVKEKKGKQYLWDFLSLKENRARIESLIEKDTAGFLKYMEGFQVQEKCMTVDFGLNGTIQEAMDGILRETLSETADRMVHLIMTGNHKNLPKIMNGIDLRAYLGGAGRNQEISETIDFNVILWEQIMSCPKGTTTGYLASGEPILEEFVDNQTYQNAYYCQKGIFAFQELYLELFYEKKKGTALLRYSPEELVEPVLRFILMPTKREAEMFGGLSHDENYGVDLTEKICPPELLEQWRGRDAEDFVEECKPGDVSWFSGFVTLLSPTYLFEKELFHSCTPYERAIAMPVRRAARDGIQYTVICGAGEAAQVMQRFLHIFGVQAEAFTDKNEKLRGGTLNGIPVRGLEDAFSADCYIIASFAYADEIEKEIRELKGEGVKIYKP